MKRLAALGITTLAGLLCLGGAGPAGAQQVVRLGHLFPTTHFEHQGFVKLAEIVAEKTGGKLKIEIFPAGQLGSEKEETEQVRSGALQMHSSGGSIQQYVPELQLIGLPGLWKSHDHVLHVMTSDVGRQIIEMAEKKHVGITVLTFTTMGVREFIGKKPVEETAGFEGVKIRVDTMPASAAIWRAVHANPVPLAFSEVYSALQTGVIDAAENPPCGIEAMKFFEQAKHMKNTDHQLTLMALQVNQKWYDSLPAGLREQLNAAVKEWLPIRYQMAKDAEATCVAKLTAQGTQIHHLKDPQKFRADLAPLQKEIGDKYHVNDLIEKIQAMD